MYFEVSNNGFYFPWVKLQRVQLVDGEALVCLLGVPEMVACVPVGVGTEAPRHRGHPQPRAPAGLRHGDQVEHQERDV